MKTCKSRIAVYCVSLCVSMTYGDHSLGEAPNPNEVTINALRYNGTGCPVDTVAEMLAPDAKAFTLIFNSFVAEAGPGIPLSAGRRSCQLAIDMRFPQGFSYSLFKVDYRGYAQIERGATGIQQSRYYFQGQVKNAVLRTTYVGPRDDDYQISDTLGIDALAWSPCGMTRALNIIAEVRASASAGRRALMTVDSIDGELTHVYGIRWRRCTL